MKITIPEGFVGILTEKGLFKDALQPGRHKYRRIWLHQNVEIVDIRFTTFSRHLPLTTADNILISASFQITYKVADPRLYKTVSSDPIQYLSSQIEEVMVVRFGRVKHDEMDTKLSEVLADAVEAINSKVKEVGLNIVSMTSPIVTLPKNIRNSIDAQVSAKIKALADLEEARGRTAVLRHYANTTDMLKDRPEVLQLLLGQKAKNVHIEFSDRK